MNSDAKDQPYEEDLISPTQYYYYRPDQPVRNSTKPRAGPYASKDTPARTLQ